MCLLPPRDGVNMRSGGIVGVDNGSWISCQKAVCDENDRSDHCQLAELESCIGREPSMAISCSLPPQPLLRRFEKGENARILWNQCPRSPRQTLLQAQRHLSYAGI